MMFVCTCRHTQPNRSIPCHHKARKITPTSQLCSHLLPNRDSVVSEWFEGCIAIVWWSVWVDLLPTPSALHSYNTCKFLYVGMYVRKDRPQAILVHHLTHVCSSTLVIIHHIPSLSGVQGKTLESLHKALIWKGSFFLKFADERPFFPAAVYGEQVKPVKEGWMMRVCVGNWLTQMARGHCSGTSKCRHYRHQSKVRGILISGVN